MTTPADRGCSAWFPRLRTYSGSALFCLVLFLGGSGAMAQAHGQAQQTLESIEVPAALAAPDPRDATTSDPISDSRDDVKAQEAPFWWGRIKFGALLQAWYLTGDGGFDDALWVRRAELKFTGEMSPQVKWTVMVDPAKAISVDHNFAAHDRTVVQPPSSAKHGGRVLQDAFLTLSYRQRLHVNIGKFKVPLSLEGLQQTAELDTERALFSSDRARGGTYGDIRDLGVMAYGRLTDRVEFQLGLFDDTLNDVGDDQRSVAARLVYRPTLLPGLQLGTSGTRGTGSGVDARRHRLGADLLYLRGPLTLKTEYMSGTDGVLKREGYYAHLAYTITPRWESLLRYDRWDPDVRLDRTAASVTERDYIAGFNYFVHGTHVKLQFNYVRKTFEDNIVPSLNLGAARLQIFW